MSKNILILLSDAGGGHMSAAKALAAGFELVEPESNVIIYNLSDEQKSFPFNSIEKSWQLVSRHPMLEAVSDFTYNVINTGPGDYLAQEMVAMSGRQVVIELLRQYAPDIVISTHFVVSAILEDIKSDFPGLFTVSIASDLVGFPRLLADENANLVFCPTEEAAKRMHKFGVPLDKIKYPFFPLKPQAPSIKSAAEFISSLDLDPDVKTVLVTGGGVGTIKMIPAISELLEAQHLQVVVICGNSHETFDTLSSRFPNTPNLHLEHFVPNLQDYFAACDLVVAKPGPATIVELEVLQKKTIFTHTVGKQELGNVAFLKQNPNFIYQPERTEDITTLVMQLVAQSYIPFPSRFSQDCSLQMVRIILDNCV